MTGMPTLEMLIPTAHWALETGDEVQDVAGQAEEVAQKGQAGDRMASDGTGLPGGVAISCVGWT